MKRGIEQDNLIKIAALFCKDIKELPEWQRNLFEGEIRRLKETERLSRQSGRYNFSRLTRIR